MIDGVRFLAATLWTDFSATGNTELAAAEAGECMNDYRRIRTQGYRRLRPADTLGEHYLARAFLEDRLRQPFSGKTVVVTHHAPAMASIAPHHVGDTTHLNAAYVNRLEHLMGPAVSLWIHGHTHTSFDYDINGTRVVCNPRGYSPVLLNPGFDPELTVEIVDPTYCLLRNHPVTRCVPPLLGQEGKYLFSPPFQGGVARSDRVVVSGISTSPARRGPADASTLRNAGSIAGARRRSAC